MCCAGPLLCLLLNHELLDLSQLFDQKISFDSLEI